MQINGQIVGTLHGREFRRCLAELDVEGVCRLHHAATGQMLTERETLLALHHARTRARSMPFRARAYSHAWLCERGMPSGLPDELKPRAERLYPRQAKAVGIAVNTLRGKTELTRTLEQAMANSVLHSLADGIDDAALIKNRMIEAFRKAIKRA
jgi:hypothetical protein